MKFCDKLAKLRKSNNLSQEQLADRLKVSRQAVSKWELGSSHPDMDKLIQMCKILNCTLDELMDDDVIGNKNIGSNQSNIGGYLEEFLKFITKISNMFTSMKLKEKIKCILELAFVFIILLIIGAGILSVADSITHQLLSIMPYSIEYMICNILSQLYTIGLIILGAIVFIHILKIRYLDYFITIEDSNVKEKKQEEPIDKEDNDNIKDTKKEKIIIRDPKHSSFNLFHWLVKIVLFLAKALSVIILLPLLLIFIITITGSVVLAYHILYGSIFLYLTIIGLGIITITFLIIKVIFDFITNRKIAYKKIFIVFICSLVAIGSGTGLSLISLTQYTQLNDTSDLKKNVYVEYLDIKDNTHIATYNNTEYIIDNSLDNIKVEIYLVDGVEYKIFEQKEERIEADYAFYQVYVSNINYAKLYEQFIKDLKNKVFRPLNYSENDYIEVKIYVSESNYNKINSDIWYY